MRILADQIRGLTISQPFASLIADGEKYVENRSWPTSYRGLLAIHAGRGTQYLDRKQLKKYPTGAVVAICRVIACESFARINSAEYGRPEREAPTFREIRAHKHTEGPFCWILAGVVKLPRPYPMKGAMSLWPIEDDGFLRYLNTRLGDVTDVFDHAP